MNRENIESKYKWDLTPIFSSEDDFNNLYKDVESKIEKFKSHEKIMGNNAESFYNAINDYYKISRDLDKLQVYTDLLSDIDTSNNNNQALKLKVINLLDKWNKATFFITPTILKKDYKEIENFYEEKPKLKEYETIIKREFRYKEHILSDIEEKLLSSMTKMFNKNYETYELLKDSDITFGNITDENNKEVELTCSNYSIYIESNNRRVRKEAFATLYSTYKQFINTFASTLSGNINENVTIAKIKKFPSTLNWCLYADELDETIYNNLINTVSDNMNTLYKYYALKKDLLNLEELHLYDIYTPIVKNFDKKYPYEEAKEIVLKALSVLGDDYIEVLKNGLDNNWVDVYPTKAKRTGGYSGGCYDTAPYILLNYFDKYNDLSTLAHEAGHSMHSYYTRSNNSYQYGNYSIFVAEVASTVNEILLSKYLLKTSNSKEEKLFILDNLMSLFKATIYRQTMFAEFEQKIYFDAENDIPLTADYLSSVYYELNKKYFGDDVVIDDDIKYEWARIPHYNFYVYKYATGLSAACHIANDILSGKEHAVDNYKEFLKCGSKKSPIESLKLAGVDLSKKEVVESAISMFNDTIDEFINLHNN